VLDAHGSPADVPYLARELGVNRYEHVLGFDFSAGDRYWESSGAFWRDVRGAWSDVYVEKDEFELVDEVDGRQMFEPFFDYAARLDEGEPYDRAVARDLIRRTFATYVR
jgi:Family of unknown function (DUF6607)